MIENDNVINQKADISTVSITTVADLSFTQDCQSLDDTASSDDSTRSARWVDTAWKYLDVCIYLAIFILVRIPVSYTTGSTMPLFLALNVLLFHATNAIPAKVKRLAHPILITSLLTVLSIWIVALTTHKTLHSSLALYKTHTSYLLCSRFTRNLPLPGAGDILSSLLDASIVSLAMPMYQYRHDLYHHLIAILGSVVALTIVSLLGIHRCATH
jgi:hypothetical protein